MSWPIGKPQSAEAKEKNRLANLGKKRTPETREKLRLAHLGVKESEETKAILRAAWKKRPNYHGGIRPPIRKRGLPSLYKDTKKRPAIPMHLIEDYRLFKRKGFSMAEALQMLGLTHH